MLPTFATITKSNGFAPTKKGAGSRRPPLILSVCPATPGVRNILPAAHY